MPTKKAIRETVCFRPDGFGSLKQVTKDAQLKDETVTYEDEIKTNLWSKIETVWKQ